MNPAVRPSQKPRHDGALLVPEEIERFENLLVFAKTTVEGVFAGRHASPYRGAAAEFSDYKEYVPGDDLGRLDWRVYGRTRRLYVRQFEEETDMAIHLMLDTSASMGYAGGGRLIKFRLGAQIAAALAYLMLAQGDKAGLVLFADGVRECLPPGGTRRHLYRMLSELERVRPASTTGIAAAVEECDGLFKKRGRLVLISDFLDDTGPLLEALSRFVHRKFEILLLQVLDPDELHLPPLSAARFVDLESGESVQADTGEIRAVYELRMQTLIEGLAREANLRRIEHRLVDTRRPYLDALEAYVGFRGKNEARR